MLLLCPRIWAVIWKPMRKTWRSFLPKIVLTQSACPRIDLKVGISEGVIDSVNATEKAFVSVV